MPSMGKSLCPTIKKAEPFRSCNLRRRAENKKPKGERINCFLLESFLRGFSIKSLISMALPAKQKNDRKAKAHRSNFIACWR